jgi:DNA-binding MarR family transcriptional regulator
MAEAGLIKKEGNPEDRRSIRVSLSLKAKRLREELAEQRKSINDELTARFSLEEKLLLKRMLKDLKG